MQQKMALVPLTRSDAVAFVDLETTSLLSTLPTRVHPQDIVISRDGAEAYVLEMGANEASAEIAGSIAVVNMARREIVRRIELAPYRLPHWAQLSGDGRRLWVACAPDRAILEVELESGEIRRVVTVPDVSPWMFVVTPDEQTLVAAGFDSATASVTNLATGEVRSLTLSGNPVGIAAAPDSSEVWIGAVGTDTIWVVDVASAKVTAVFASAVPGPVRMEFTPDGAKVVVTHNRGGQVIVYDVRSREMRLTVPTGDDSWPKGFVLTSDGTLAYVSLMGLGKLAVVDLISGTMRAAVEVGTLPERAGVWAEG
jgi:DNA-binding beta-propeller fold protein YncE